MFRMKYFQFQLIIGFPISSWALHIDITNICVRLSCIFSSHLYCFVGAAFSNHHYFQLVRLKVGFKTGMAGTLRFEKSFDNSESCLNSMPCPSA